MTGIFIGLGSNQGDRLANLRAAVVELEKRGIALIRASSVYETAPVGKTDQPVFLNAVIEVETEEEPRGLLAECLEVEKALGRIRGERWGPRTIDLDILLYRDEAIKENGLVVPHPELAKRRFVLEPLLEIAPDLTVPGIGKLAECLEKAALQEVSKNGPLITGETG
ncbi:MAG: 2-amino-4-hydroxy-6-hydroxymethyldihydropteridine diphosphokinase [Candidatus Aquicultorales bacterium]